MSAKIAGGGAAFKGEKNVGRRELLRVWDNLCDISPQKGAAAAKKKFPPAISPA